MILLTMIYYKIIAVVYLWIPSEQVGCIQLVYFILGFMTKVAEKWSKSGRKVVERVDNVLNFVYNNVR